MRLLRAVFALVLLLGLFTPSAAAETAAGLRVSVYGASRQTARSAVNVTTYAKEKVSAVSVELTIDGQPVRLDGYRNTSSTSFADWPFTQDWSNGVELDRPLAELQAKVSVTYESGATVVVERQLRPLVDAQITDLAYSPTDLGESHGPVTFTGLVTYKKNATEAVPAPGAKVRIFSDGFNSTTVSTGADGRFTLTTYKHDAGLPAVHLLSETPYAGSTVYGTTAITMAKATTRISWSVPRQDDLWVGDVLNVSGLLEWRASTGEWLPLGAARYVQIGCGDQIVYAQTERDGTFSRAITPEKPCRLSVMFSTGYTMFHPAYGSHAPQVRQHAALTGLTWPKSPVVQGVPFSLTGTYVALPGKRRSPTPSPNCSTLRTTRVGSALAARRGPTPTERSLLPRVRGPMGTGGSRWVAPRPSRLP